MDHIEHEASNMRRLGPLFDSFDVSSDHGALHQKVDGAKVPQATTSKRKIAKNGTIDTTEAFNFFSQSLTLSIFSGSLSLESFAPRTVVTS